jgi:hypothetical protein
MRWIALTMAVCCWAAAATESEPQTKLVNGVRVNLTAAEKQEVKAKWQAGTADAAAATAKQNQIQQEEHDAAESVKEQFPQCVEEQEGKMRIVRVAPILKRIRERLMELDARVTALEALP